jgi:hypothetical protein
LKIEIWEAQKDIFLTSKYVLERYPACVAFLIFALLCIKKRPKDISGLFYMRRMNSQWNIQEESREDFSLQILVDILRLSIEKVKTLNLDETDWRGCSLVHRALKSLRAIDPEWSINGSKRVIRTNK